MDRASGERGVQGDLGHAGQGAAHRAAFLGRDRVLLVDVAADDMPTAIADIDEAARPWLLASIDPQGEPFAVARARITALREAAAERMLRTSTTRAVCKPGENLHLAGGCGPGA